MARYPRGWLQFTASPLPITAIRRQLPRRRTAPGPSLLTYTESGGKGEPARRQESALPRLREMVEVCRGLFHGFDVAAFLNGSPVERLMLLPAAQEHVFKLDDGRDRLVAAVTELSRVFVAAMPHEEALAVRDEVAFYQAVKAAIMKTSPSASGKSEAEVELAIRQIVSKAISTDGVIDVFAAAGLKRPDISILSEEFLADVRAMPHKNLAVEVLRKLLHDELKVRRRTNLVQSEAFSDKLERTIARYRNRAVGTVQVIEELIEIARETRAAQQRGDELKLNDAELAFYDALGANDSAVKVLGDVVLAQIARELTETVRSSVTIDWTVKETVRAKLRTLVRRKLRKHGYPPDRTEKAVETVLRQAETLALEWAT